MGGTGRGLASGFDLETEEGTQNKGWGCSHMKMCWEQKELLPEGSFTWLFWGPRFSWDAGKMPPVSHQVAHSRRLWVLSRDLTSPTISDTRERASRKPLPLVITSLKSHLSLPPYSNCCKCVPKCSNLEYCSPWDLRVRHDLETEQI